MLKDSPGEPFVLFALAREYAKAGNHGEALRYYKQLLSYSPDYTGTYYHLGKLYEQLGKQKDAIATYKVGMEITKQRGEHHAFGELQSALSMISDEK